ncbi:MAG: cation transporter [Ignavibacterium sp.]|nr:cation transporter [Ignavibacterium sp.]
MQKTVFHIPKMDCPSEENLIKLKLNDFSDIINLDFDIPNRKLTIFHYGNFQKLKKALDGLNLGSKILSNEESDQTVFSEQSNQRKVLWIVLVINFSFFLIEMITGIVSRSMGLVADSLDMLADAFVYGISLYAVGGTLQRKKSIAKIAGYFQITLAVIGFVEVVRRFIGAEAMPDFRTMIIVSVFALAANATCLYLLMKSKSKDAHMRASMIFTSNDVIINIGVILAGVLVLWFNSSLPDLIVGSAVFILVMFGAARILKLAK